MNMPPEFHYLDRAQQEVSKKADKYRKHEDCSSESSRKCFHIAINASTYSSRVFPHCMLPMCLAGYLIFGFANIFYS